MQIQGHRGGFQPENTMMAFQQAVEHDIKAIEIDIWLTSDNIAVILHGGEDGELNHHFSHFTEAEYIFEKTFDQLSKFDMGLGERIPTLSQLLTFSKQNNVFINIELKVPRAESALNAYRYKDCARIAHDLIQSHEMTDQVLFSSFNRDILQEIEMNNLSTYGDSQAVETIYLMNFHQEQLPEPSVYTNLGGSGINVSSIHITQEVVDHCHRQGQKVGVWISKKIEIEGDELYLRLLKMGVDFICSDYPHLVKNSQDAFEQTVHSSQSILDIEPSQAGLVDDLIDKCSQVSVQSDDHYYQIESADMESDEQFLKSNFNSGAFASGTSTHSTIENSDGLLTSNANVNVLSFKDLQLIRRNFFYHDIEL
eukprot:403350767